MESSCVLIFLPFIVTKCRQVKRPSPEIFMTPIKKEPMTALTIRVSQKTSKAIDQLAIDLKLEQPAVVIRWILDSFLESVEDKSDPPSIPVVLTMARQYRKSKRKYAK
tara:strand:+ start:346 stop:669 length:324 start_codon:yes stop_codon:yes gene_type:complete